MQPAEKYKPQIVGIVPWEKIEDHYRNLIEHHNWPLHGMLSLVNSIRNSLLEKTLYGYISHDELLITIYNPAEWNRETLHIRLDPVSLLWHFHYQPKPYQPPERKKLVSHDGGIAQFNEYVKALKW